MTRFNSIRPGRCTACDRLLIAKLDGEHSLKCAECRRESSSRSKQRRSSARITPSVRDLVIARDGMICRHCGNPVRSRQHKHDIEHDTIELDHLIPVADGGCSTVENLVVSCLGCNRQRAGTARVQRRLAS